MLTSNWDTMFQSNLIGEALIKFEIQDYGTLYKTDIYSYSFKGRSRWLCDEYPSFKAVIKAVNRPEYSNYSNFINKRVVVSYGFIRNGSEEYVDAMRLIIENLTISDDGRIATFELNSIFSKYTNTFKVKLPYIESEAQFNSYTYSHFLSDMSNNGFGYYYRHSTGNYSYRTLPTKISVGQAVQEMTFLNCACMRIEYNSINHGETIYIEGDMFDEAINYPINILKHPHIERIAYSPIVVVDYYQRADLRMGEIQYVYTTEQLETYTGTGQSPLTYKAQKTLYFEQEGFYLSTWFTWWGIAYSSDQTQQATDSDGGGVDNTLYNNQMDIYAKSNKYGGKIDVKVYAVPYKNYISYEVDKTSIFNINITSQEQADAIQSRVANYLSSQKTIELQLRINPAFEILDTLFFDNTHKRMYIEELDIDFNGAYKGRVKGVFKDDFVAPVVNSIVWNAPTNVKITLQNNNKDFAVKWGFEYEDGTQISCPSSIYVIGKNGGTRTLTYNLNPWQPDGINIVSKLKAEGMLERNVYVYFKKGDGRSEHTLLYTRDKIQFSPIVEGMELIDSQHYTIGIHNPNNEELLLNIHCSAGEQTFTIGANESFELTYDNCSILEDSVNEYVNQDLHDEVYCWFEDTNGAISDNEIILEANA